MDGLRMLGFPAVPQTGDPSIQVLFFTSHPLLRRGGDRARGSEVTLLTERIVGTLAETLGQPCQLTLLPTGDGEQRRCRRDGAQGGRCYTLS